MPNDTPNGKLPKSMHGSVPAWTGAVAAVGYILAQAMGLDPAAITGKGQAHQVAALEKRMDDTYRRVDQRLAAADTRVTAVSARIRSAEQSVGILFERSEGAKEQRAEIKQQLSQISSSLSAVATAAARIEAKLNRSP